MDRNKYEVMRLTMERTAEALRKNNFYAVCAENREEALEIVENLIDENSSVAVGGSVTLSEVGILDLLRSGKYIFYDRYAEGLTRSEIENIHHKALSADYYLCSSNAVTEDGMLYNVDGNGNRVAAMIYGPENVIVVVGFNKIVTDIDEAKMRVKNIAAPSNAVRLSRNTPCTLTGKCADCKSADRICAVGVTISRPMRPERIKVVLVGEELGY
ncbi:MAG: lactate utilization protein [Clostridia bacterium]|nr:lactate utilization protein [Clostridia bacterium]